MLRFLMLSILIISQFTISAQNKKYNSEEIFQKCSKSVVTVWVKKGKEYFPVASGVFITNNGHLVTNYHVLKGIIDISPDNVFVKNENKYENLGSLICFWEEADLAIFKISNNSFKSIQVDNNNTLKKGSKIFTISSPLGFENSITEGIVSNLIKGLQNYPDIYTEIIVDAKFTHGSSGGALINEYGELVGILQGGIEGQNENGVDDGARANINYAIPITFLNVLISTSTCDMGSNPLKFTNPIQLRKNEPIIYTPKGLEANPGEVNID
jgi:serine protease Do